MSDTESEAAAPAELQAELGELSATGRTRHQRLRSRDGRTGRTCSPCWRPGSSPTSGCAADGVMVVPTVYGFKEDELYLHGSVASQSLAADAPACVTITLVDGLVLARSVFEHAVNYRSAVIYAVPRIVDDPAEKLAGLRCVSEHLAPGQWDYVRQPSRKDWPPPGCCLLAGRGLGQDPHWSARRRRQPRRGARPVGGRGAAGVALAGPVPDPALPPGQQPPAHIRALTGTLAYQHRREALAG